VLARVDGDITEVETNDPVVRGDRFFASTDGLASTDSAVSAWLRRHTYR